MPTKAEREHMTKVGRLGCIVCLNQGYGPTPAELHHPRHGTGMGKKASHFDVIPLCHAHHRTGGYGVAFHAGKQAFEDNFGTEAELLAAVGKELGKKEAA